MKSDSSRLFQIAKANKPLLAVSKLIDMDYRVIFDKDGSYVMSKRGGPVMRLRRERGVFVLDAWVNQDPESASKEPEKEVPFRRHG